MKKKPLRIAEIVKIGLMKKRRGYRRESKPYFNRTSKKFEDMKLKLGPQTTDLRRVRRIVKVADSLAKIRFHTGEAILVRCSVRYPDGFTFTYPGTVEELRGLLNDENN